MLNSLEDIHFFSLPIFFIELSELVESSCISPYLLVTHLLGIWFANWILLKLHPEVTCVLLSARGGVLFPLFLLFYLVSLTTSSQTVFSLAFLEMHHPHFPAINQLFLSFFNFYPFWLMTEMHHLSIDHFSLLYILWALLSCNKVLSVMGEWHLMFSNQSS